MPKLHLNPWKDQRGTTAVEFAFVSPAIIILIVGIIFLCLGITTAMSLRFTVKDGARCASVLTAQCSDAATTIAYMKSHYFGIGTPNFVYNATATCGRSVTATLSYELNLGLKKTTIPFSATACFPS